MPKPTGPTTLFETEPKLTTTAVAPWFGSNRMLGPEVAKELRGCKWVGIPFAGGMAELAHIKASTIVVSDLHRHVINLALVIQSDELRPQLLQWLHDNPFHPEILERSQAKCKVIEHEHWRSSHGNVEWAGNYFVACWMGRSHKSGIDDEFNGKLSIRWNASGGDSNKRYRSAVASLEAWGEIMRRCNFAVMDAFDFLGRCEDEDENGIYPDPPFPKFGRRYKHNCGDDEAEEQIWHTRLRDALLRFRKTRIVCRFYDHPLIRELYPADLWRWNLLDGGRTQANEKAPEVLLVRNGDPA